MDFSAQMIEEVKEAFELFSKPGEDHICYDQVGDLIRALGECPTNEEIMKLLQYPSNEELQSKKMTYEEFLPILSHIVKTAHKPTQEDFIEGLKVFDKDGSGTIRGAEIRHILTTLGEKMTSREVEMMMQGQEDNSGSVNCEEFAKFLLERTK